MVNQETRRPYKKFFLRRKKCPFKCKKKETQISIDYRDVPQLSRYVSDSGKIEPRRKTGVCAKCQRVLARAIKNARELNLIPYNEEHILQTKWDRYRFRPKRQERYQGYDYKRKYSREPIKTEQNIPAKNIPAKNNTQKDITEESNSIKNDSSKDKL